MTYSYFDDDQTQTVTDARGAATSFAYNNRGLVTNINFTAPAGVAQTPNVSFAYDAAGNRTQMSDGLGTASYAYNPLSQLTSETRTFNGVGSYTLAYEYGLTGQLTKVTNPWSVSVSYTLDRAGRLESVTGANYAGVSTYLQNIAYRASGATKSQSYGNGRAYTATYDNRLRLKSWDVAGVTGAEYAYANFTENTGRVTYARNTYDGTLDRSYDYDHVGRLISSYTGAEARAHAGEPGGAWNGDGIYAQIYYYDQFGNITARSGWGGQAWSYPAVEFNGKNQNVRNQVNYQPTTWDAAGNVTNDGVQQFTYDATGQTTLATSGNLQMSYDGERLRGKKVDHGVTTYYLRSSVLGGAVVAEMNGSGSWTRGYVYGGGGLLAIQQEGQVEYVHQDPVTKSQRLTNQAGQVTAALEFDPWGGEAARSVNTERQPHKYTTYERDTNGTDEAMHRRYNRWWTRFEQPDPYDGSYNLADPQSFNRYAYVQNDPVNFVDPSGLNMIGPGSGGFCVTRTRWDEGSGTLYISTECSLTGGGGVVGASPRGSRKSRVCLVCLRSLRCRASRFHCLIPVGVRLLRVAVLIQ